MREDTPTFAVLTSLLLLAKVLLGTVDWAAVNDAIYSAAGLLAMALVTLALCLLVSAVTGRSGASRPPRVRRRDRPIIGQPAYYAVT